MPTRVPVHPILAMLALAALASCQSAETASGAPAGAAIYRRQCAECHGKNGEGVRDRFATPLAGDWSVEKLARYIHKTMPEDDPSACEGPEAESVARYIHASFYSREARLRNQKPRIEVTRLTNTQYLTTVADLVQSFTGGDGQAGGQPGLAAAIYRSREKRREQLALERVDPAVDFDFGTGSPAGDKVKPEEFAIRWTGSLLADETGDHEITLRTQNGARLWLNGEEEPVVDALVSSGTEPREHTVKLRLLGGRAYPLRLEIFKFKEKTASVTVRWKPPHGAAGVIPPRNLRTESVSPTLVVGTRFPADDSSVGYERGVAVDRAWDEATTRAALEVVHALLPRLDRLAGTEPGAANRAEKLRDFCAEFAGRAARRPLGDEERRRRVDRHFEGQPDALEGAKRSLLHSLKSPEFLYLGLVEPGREDHARAARLSYALWDSPPDRELRQAAADGRLRTEEQVRAQAARMLRDPRARQKLRGFLHHWLQMDRVEDLAKDETLFPGFGPEITGDLRTSLNLFLDDVAWNGTPDYRRFLLSDELFVNTRLAEFYGLPERPGPEFIRVSAGPAKRSGVLTHPYLLTAFSYARSTSPIHRGVFLTRNVVGRALKPPPMAIAFKDEQFSPDLTMRQKVEKLTRPDACQSCHAVINPLGFSLEHYDAVGRYRADLGRQGPVDAVSDYTTDEGETIRLTGARDLAEFAAGSEQAQVGFIEQLFHHMVKQPMLAHGAGCMDELRGRFAASGFNLHTLMVDIAAMSALTPPHPAAKPETKP